MRRCEPRVSVQIRKGGVAKKGSYHASVKEILERGGLKVCGRKGGLGRFSPCKESGKGGWRVAAGSAPHTGKQKTRRLGPQEMEQKRRGKKILFIRKKIRLILFPLLPASSFFLLSVPGCFCMHNSLRQPK